MAEYVLWTLTDGDVVIETRATDDGLGNITFTFELVSGSGDINGLYIDINNDGGSISDLGGGNNMNGAGDGFDFAVALGSVGGNDADVTMGTVTGFTLVDFGVSDLEELAASELGFRLTSVGDDREGSLKLLAVGEYYPDFEPDPGLSVTKTADVQSVAAADSEIVYTYEVVNEGNVALTNVTLMDDNFTPGDSGDDFAPVYQSGDTNLNGELDVDETWIYSAKHTVTQEEMDAGTDLVNVVTADSDQTDEATDDETVEVVQTPGLSVIKTADVTSVSAAGEEIFYTYELRNTGNVSLTGVTLMDDNFTPGDTGDDFAPTFTGGDTDGDGKLDLDEVWTYTASHTVTDEEFEAGADLVNVATADSDQTGEETDDHTVEIKKAGIEIEKWIKANGQWYEADDDANMLKLLATEGKLEYKIVVTNTGDVDLTGVEVWDPNLGIPQWCAIDVGTIEVGGQAILTAEEYCKLEVCWSKGEELNTAFADSDQTDVVSDDANYFGAVVCLDVDKVTIDEFGNEGDDLVVKAGSDIQWKYTVTNNGNVDIALADLTMFDDNGTWDESDDWDLTNLVSGDDGDGILNAGESWVFVESGTAIDGGGKCDDEGRYSNYAIVSVDYTDDAGLTRTYNAVDTSSYTLEGYGDDKQDDADQQGDNCHFEGDEKDDEFIGCKDDEWFYGRNGNDLIKGKGGADYIVGQRGSDQAFGGKGADFLIGGHGKDWLKGGGGKDYVEGGENNDKLWGGSGCDTFKFGDGDGKDRVMDFDATGRKHDIIDLSDVSDIGGWKDLKNNHIEEVDKGIWIHSDNVEIFLKDVEWADLDKGDFCF